MGRYYDLVGLDNTYWDLPKSVIERAFGRKPVSRARETFLVGIKALIECDTREELDRVLKAGHALYAAMHTLETYRKTDTVLGQMVLEAVNRYVLISRTNPLEIYSDTWRAYALLVFAEIAGIKNIDEKGMTDSPAEYLAEATGNILPIYDGSLNILIEATRLYLKNLQTDPTLMPKRNDLFDRYHLSYLRPDDQDQFIVIRDRGFRHLVNLAAPERAIKMEKFVDLMIRN